MADSKNITNFREKVDDKEKELIHKISESVANGIQDELGESLSGLVESVDNACESITQIYEISQNLSLSMEAIQKYDFSEKISELQTVQDTLNSTLDDAKAMLEEGKSFGEQYIKDSENVSKEWFELKSRFTQTIERVMDGNSAISGNLSELDKKIKELDSLQERMNDTLQLLDEKFSDQTNRRFMEIVGEFQRHNQSIFTQLNNIQQQLRTSPSVVALMIMAVVIMVLQIVSFFI